MAQILESREHRCPLCSRQFSSAQALGSHLRYKHKSKGDSPTSPSESLDLSSELIQILTQAGVRSERAKLIASICFDRDPENLEQLDEVLRLAGIPNPSRRLTLTRWAQRVGKPVPRELLEKEPEEKPSGISKLLEEHRRLELEDLMIQELKLRIAERESKLKKDEPEDEQLELRIRLQSLEDAIRGLHPARCNRCGAPNQGIPLYTYFICWYCGASQLRLQ